MSTPLWLVNLVKKSFPGRFVLAKTTRAPLIGAAVDRLLFAGDDLFYLPSDHTVRRIQVRRPVENPASTVLPSQVVEHYVGQAGYHWIMNTCICRDASHCRDFPIDLGCLFLGEAVQGIDPRLGRRVSKDEALAHVRRAREAGLIHLIGRNKLDTVWLGIGPGTKLLTICHCCPCCCLWKMAPHLASDIGDKVTAMTGVSIAVSERCQGCGTCTGGVCFVDAIHMRDGQAVINEQCRGCGRCVDVCPHEAIDLYITDSQFVSGAIERIAPLVDVR